MDKIDRSFIRKTRYFVQWTIFFMVLYAGVNFYFFARALELGAIPSVTRSPSIEGFMPIGALMALKLWITAGIFDPVHPAALVIFLGSTALAVILKKSFCGWICPVGALSELGWKVGSRLFSRNFRLPRHVDYAVRSLKYILMFFFLYIVLLKMSAAQITGFLDTPYWKVADIKLLKFFTEMSPATGLTLVFLFGLSVLYKNFWCRFLCPYGALLGLLSILSPVKIRRDESKCINCGLCSKNCPSSLPVDKKRTIRSPECTACLTCVSRCPAKGALDVAIMNRKGINPAFFAAAIVALFFGTILIGKLTGRWDSSLTIDELLRLVPSLDALAHP